MDQFLSLSADQRRQFCEQVAGNRGVPPVSIEKDFWVCWTLRELFDVPDWAGHLAFKGGTSLSKAWGLINRFSEDVDIVIDRAFLGFGGDSLGTKKQKKLVKTCSQRVQQELRPALEARFRAGLPAEAEWSLTPASPEEDKDQQTLLFTYPCSRIPACSTALPGISAARSKSNWVPVQTRNLPKQ